MKVSVNNTRPVGFLLVAFIVLKLCHVIEWPWVWVLSPFWIPLALCLSFILFALFMAVVTGQVRRR